MPKTADLLTILVGEDKTPIQLTDSAVQAVQGEAAGKLTAALANLWQIEKSIEPGQGFDDLDINDLLGLRDHAQLAVQMADVLIDCRPLSDLAEDDDSAR